MLPPRLGALLLATASSAQAFHDAAPFFTLSTDPLDPSLSSAQLSTPSRIETDLRRAHAHCPSSLYLIVSQPQLSASDVRDSMPSVRRTASDGKYQSRVEIAQIVGGELDPFRLSVGLEQTCSGADVRVVVAPTSLPAPAADAFFDTHVLPLLANHTSHTLVWLSSTSAPENVEYQMDDEPFHSALHTDLKRDAGVRAVADETDDPQAGLPLFERYQFLSPALFMGLSVSILLFLILYVGISAIAGLDVSYLAFSKENGPQGQQAKNKAQ